MKTKFKKILSVSTCIALILTMLVTTAVSAAASYYSTYTTLASIGNRSSCSALQGVAVGSTWIYTVKIKTDNSSAVLQKTNKNTGATTNLTSSSGSATFNYLNHANDMDVATVDGYSNLYIATMATGSNSLVRMKIDGSKAIKAGSYTVMLNGAQKSVSAVSVISTTETDINFLFKVGTRLYTGSVAKSATSGTIDITPAFKINISSVVVNGSTLDLSKYTHQGMGYHNGWLFVPLWGGGASKSNVSIVAVYNTKNASGTITSDPNLSFRITSSTYTGFEIESCDISSDNRLYFGANRWTSSSGNYDGVFYFSSYKYSEPAETPTDSTTDPNATYFPACDSSQTTLIGALESIGVDSSYAYRATIAAANGIAGYTGAAEQNTQMLNLLKAGKLIKPGSTDVTQATEATETTEATEITEATEATEDGEPSAYLLGDVDFDGEVNILDATEIQKIIAGLVESTVEINKVADVNADNLVDVTDATQIQKYCAELIDGFITEEATENTEPETEESTTEVPATEPTTEEITTEAPTTEPTTSAVTYFPACDSSHTSLVNALASVGAEYSLAYRKTVAAANGITGYTGTADQNTQLLNLMKQGKLIKP